MTRSDLILEIARKSNNANLVNANLIDIMHTKIEAVYSVLFSLEKLEGDDPVTKGFKQIGELIRIALES